MIVVYTVLLMFTNILCFLKILDWVTLGREPVIGTSITNLIVTGGLFLLQWVLLGFQLEVY